MKIVWSSISEEEIFKLRFPLKLWLVTNEPSMTCLRWNQEGTILIVNKNELFNMFTMETSNIFMCKNIRNFIWLLLQHAFKLCPSEVLDEAERSRIEPESMLFWHPEFFANNSQIFDAWLANPAIRVHEPKELKGTCTLLPQMQFVVQEMNEEFAQNRTNILIKMLNLRLKISQSLREKVNGFFTVPLEHSDYQVMDVPDYFKTKEIEGNYGPVSVSELKECLGDLLPRSYNDLADDSDEMEEVIVLVDDETSSVADDPNIKQEAASIATEAPGLQFKNLRELYESAKSWTDIDGNMYEEYEIDENASHEAKIDNVDESVENAKESHSLLTNQNQPQDDISEYLTKSVQACIPAIDIE